jgi:protein-S-isoprenylcysteine O-methyltransferase Ste14
MSLLRNFEKQGNLLFRYRGQFPVLLFLVAVPFIYETSTRNISDLELAIFRYSAVLSTLAGFLFRAFAIGTTPKGTSGRNTEEQVAEQLNTSGLYSTVRHPLYFGNYLMWLGIVLFTYNISFVLLFTLAFWLYYERIMYAEERFLEKKFGEAFLHWASGVPAFIPRMNRFTKSNVPFSLKTVLRREYSGVLATIVAFFYIHTVRKLFLNGDYLPSVYWQTILVAAVLSALILRSLKKYTRLLSENDRS